VDGICAIGRVREDGPWIGFQPGPAGYRVVAGRGSVVRGRTADTDLLLALAIAWFEEAFDDPPAELEASQEDLSGLVRQLAASEPDPERRRALLEAVDAIDDGLAGDAVANRLSEARRGSAIAGVAGVANAQQADEQADPVDLLVTLAEELLRD
jgi:hypothetical protein